jgi:hypothetical protein
MQRNRGHDIGRVEEKAVGLAREQRSQSGRQLGVVFVLEAVNGARDGACVRERGEGALEPAREGAAARASRLERVERAGLGASVAPLGRSSLDQRLTRVTEEIRRREHRAAPCAGRGKDEIE